MDNAIQPSYNQPQVFSHYLVTARLAMNTVYTCLVFHILILCLQDVDEFKNYKIFMSTIFKLLGSNSTIDEEVNRIVDLEREFKDVCVIDNFNSHFHLCTPFFINSIFFCITLAVTEVIW